jgi:hypothetical protein
MPQNKKEDPAAGIVLLCQLRFTIQIHLLPTYHPPAPPFSPILLFHPHTNTAPPPSPANTAPKSPNNTARASPTTTTPCTRSLSRRRAGRINGISTSRSEPIFQTPMPISDHSMRTGTLRPRRGTRMSRGETVREHFLSRLRRFMFLV